MKNRRIAWFGRVMLLVGIVAALLMMGGCSGEPELSPAELDAALRQYERYEGATPVEEVLDWADAVIQVEVLHDRALPEELVGQATAVHVDQAICGSVADSDAVNDRATAALYLEEGRPALTEGQKLILAVRERVLPEGITVFDYDAGLTYYLYGGEYLISATDDNETAALNGYTLEGLTETMWPIFHPGQTKFTRSLLNAQERMALTEASPFTCDETGERMDYGMLRGILRACNRDEARLDLMTVQQGGRLALAEELYAGGGDRIQQLEDCDLPEGARVIVARGRALYGVNDADQLICLTPEAASFALTGITLAEFKDSLEDIAP